MCPTKKLPNLDHENGHFAGEVRPCFVLEVLIVAYWYYSQLIYALTMKENYLANSEWSSCGARSDSEEEVIETASLLLLMILSLYFWLELWANVPHRQLQLRVRILVEKDYYSGSTKGIMHWFNKRVGCYYRY